MKPFFIELNQIENISFEYNSKLFTFTLPSTCKLPIIFEDAADELVDLHIGKSCLANSSFTIYESCSIKKFKRKKGYTDFLITYKKIRSAYAADIRGYVIDEMLSSL